MNKLKSLISGAFVQDDGDENVMTRTCPTFRTVDPHSQPNSPFCSSHDETILQCDDCAPQSRLQEITVSERRLRDWSFSSQFMLVLPPLTRRKAEPPKSGSRRASSGPRTHASFAQLGTECSRHRVELAAPVVLLSGRGNTQLPIMAFPCVSARAAARARPPPRCRRQRRWRSRRKKRLRTAHPAQPAAFDRRCVQAGS